MECLKCNKKNKKLYEKINYTKLLLVIIISFVFFTISFYYIGEKRDIGNSIRVASIISILLGASSIMGDIIDNRNRIFILDDDNIGYIEIHISLKIFYLQIVVINHILFIISPFFKK